IEGPPMELTPEIIPIFLQISLAPFYLERDTSRLIEAIQKEYFEGAKDKEELVKRTVELLGDMHFVNPTLKVAAYHSGLSSFHSLFIYLLAFQIGIFKFRSDYHFLMQHNEGY